jgi:hypothetical protein
METHDSRVINAREFLIGARKQMPSKLTPDVLVREDAELRRCLASALDVIDDFAATVMDEEVTQVTIEGGLYVAPKDYGTLCGSCQSVLLARVKEDETLRQLSV